LNADFIKSGVAGLIGTLIIALNHKLGLELAPAEQAFIVSIVLGFISKEVLNNRAPDVSKPSAVDQVAAMAKAAAPVVVAAIAGMLLLAPGPAHALEPTVGPSLPAVAITPGGSHPAQIAAGAGFTVGVDFFETKLLNQKAHWLTVGLDVYGSAGSAGAGLVGNAVVALHLCLLGLFCAGPGLKLLDSSGFGALDGKLDHRSFLVMIEPDCRVMKLLWPLFASAPPAPATSPPEEAACDGDHPCAPAGGAP
jgi:hypothetical protein